MAYTENLSKLNTLLANLMPENDQALNLAEQAGLPREHIDADGAAYDTWHNIISEADNRSKVLDVIQAAQSIYPERSSDLEQIKAAYVAESGGKKNKLNRWIPINKRMFVSTITGLLGALFVTVLAGIVLQTLSAEPKIQDVTLIPSPIDPEGVGRITWTVEHADFIEIDPDHKSRTIKSGQESSYFVVQPTKSMTYTLRATRHILPFKLLPRQAVRDITVDVAEKGCTVTAGLGLNLREGAEEMFRKLRNVPRGETFHPIAYDPQFPKWLHVSVDTGKVSEEVGWLHAAEHAKCNYDTKSLPQTKAPSTLTPTPTVTDTLIPLPTSTPTPTATNTLTPTNTPETVIKGFSVSPTQVDRGLPVTLWVAVDNAAEIKIVASPPLPTTSPIEYANPTPEFDEPISLSPTENTKYTLIVKDTSGKEQRKRAEVTVNSPFCWSIRPNSLELRSGPGTSFIPPLGSIPIPPDKTGVVKTFEPIAYQEGGFETYGESFIRWYLMKVEGASSVIDAWIATKTCSSEEKCYDGLNIACKFLNLQEPKLQIEKLHRGPPTLECNRTGALGYNITVREGPSKQFEEITVLLAREVDFTLKPDAVSEYTASDDKGKPVHYIWLHGDIEFEGKTLTGWIAKQEGTKELLDCEHWIHYYHKQDRLLTVEWSPEHTEVDSTSGILTLTPPPLPTASATPTPTVTPDIAATESPDYQGQRPFDFTAYLGVPERTIFGSLSERDTERKFILPEEYEMVGEPQVLSKNLGGMSERDFRLQPITNGVQLHWQVANPNNQTRSAVIRVRLWGKKR